MRTLPSGTTYSFDNQGRRICTGSAMGRRDTPHNPDEDSPTPRLRLHRLQWVDGDYDEGGAYWGHTPGTFIYWAEGDDTAFECFVRATSRQDALSQVLAKLPTARFFR